ANLDWSGFYYVAPSWSGGGAGFRQGPSALNVAFVTCEAAAEVPCYASISSTASATTVGFRPKSAIVAAGYHSETIKVSAYSHGRFVGSEVYSLTPSLQTMNFPPGWETATQLVVEATRGTVVFYALDTESASASASADVGASAAPHQNAAPSAPVGIVDPPPMDLPTIVEPPIILIGPAAHNIQKPSGNAVGQAQPDDLIRKTAPNAIQKPGGNAVGQAQPDDLIRKTAPNAIQKPGGNAVGQAQPDDLIRKTAPNAIQKPSANAVGKAQPDDLVYKPGPSVIGTQGPSAIGAAQPDDMIRKPADPNAIQK